MNKQIQECMYNAGLNSNYVEEFDSIYSKQLEKFAQLIVQECVRYFNEDYTRNFDVLWREDLSKAIEQHFEVTHDT